MKRVFIIAEAGVNHNGSQDLALKLVDAAANAKADAVKFQTFKSEAVISRYAAKAEYQKATTGTSESQLDMVRKLELSQDAHRAILDRCRERAIGFISTPFDFDSANFLVHGMNVSVVKVPSGEITNAPFLLHIARLNKPIILSTGMSTIGEIEMALGVFAFGYLGNRERPSEAAFRDAFASDAGQSTLRDRVSLLHCTTEYPAPFDQVNLRAMDTLAATFGLPVGLSDHTSGFAVAIAAVARGGTIIEKHFTLDRNMHGPDHKASLEPSELVQMVSGIREVELALGSPLKRPSAVEWANRAIARRSLVAANDVAAGSIWTAETISAKRPGTGVSPMRYWEIIGTTAKSGYHADELID